MFPGTRVRVWVHLFFVGPVIDSILHCNTSPALPVFCVSGVNDSLILLFI